MQLLSLLQEFTSQFEQWSSCASLISLRKLIKAYFQSQLRANSAILPLPFGELARKEGPGPGDIIEICLGDMGN